MPLTRIASSPYAYLHYRDDQGAAWLEVVCPSPVMSSASFEVVRRFSPEELAARAQTFGWASEVIQETRGAPRRYINHDHAAELRALQAGPTIRDEMDAAALDARLGRLCEGHWGGWFRFQELDVASLASVPQHLHEGPCAPATPLQVAALATETLRARLIETIDLWLLLSPDRKPLHDPAPRRIADEVLALLDRFFAHRPLRAAGYLYAEIEGPGRDWYTYRSPWSDPRSFDVLLETKGSLYLFHCGWNPSDLRTMAAGR